MQHTRERTRVAQTAGELAARQSKSGLWNNTKSNCIFLIRVKEMFRYPVRMSLEEAITVKDVELARGLLASGTSPNSVDKHNHPLLFEAIRSGQIEFVELLLEKGAEVNVQYCNGDHSTPLHWAAGGGMAVPNVAIAKILLAKGAKVDAKTKAGNTPLIWAAKSNSEHAIPVAELLLAHGADINLPGEDGPAFIVAKYDGTNAMFEFLHRKKKLLLEGNQPTASKEKLATNKWTIILSAILALALLTNLIWIACIAVVLLAVHLFLFPFPGAKPACEKCKGTDIEHVENTHPSFNMAQREVADLLRLEHWECNTCKHQWRIWQGTRGSYDESVSEQTRRTHKTISYLMRGLSILLVIVGVGGTVERLSGSVKREPGTMIIAILFAAVGLRLWFIAKRLSRDSDS